MIEQKQTCVECKACEYICPKNCISFSCKGMMQIDIGSCIKCGLCEKVCQNIELPSFSQPKRVFAAINLDDKSSENSSSGGIAQLLYSTIIKGNGVVFGVKYDDNLQPHIECTDTIAEVVHYLKSKYCFSNVGDSYKRCKDICEDGRKVLFIGLPCQIAGLRKYLHREYDNLYLVDILCHGAPHYSIFENHIKYVQKKRKRSVIDYQFRNKKYDSYGPYNYSITYQDREIESGSALWDAYYSAFLKAEIFREACYNCKFARNERVSDVTIGDFWKANEEIDGLKDKKYVSSILINSNKGEVLFEKCKKNMQIFESCMESLEKSTHAVTNPSKMPINVLHEELKDFNYYCRWASKYENSVGVFLRKVKNHFKCSLGN